MLNDAMKAAMEREVNSAVRGMVIDAVDEASRDVNALVEQRLANVQHWANEDVTRRVNLQLGQYIDQAVKTRIDMILSQYSGGKQ